MMQAETKEAVRQALCKSLDRFVYSITRWESDSDTPMDRAAGLVLNDAVFWKVDRVAVFTTVLTDVAWSDPKLPSLQGFLQEVEV